MLVTLAWVGLWIGLIIEAIFLIYLAWDFLSYINKIEPKKKIEEKFWEAGLHTPTLSERKRRREEKHTELMDRSYNSLVPQVEFILKKYGWTKGNDNLWSNKDYTNLTFGEAMEEHNLLVLEDEIAHTERINKN